MKNNFDVFISEGVHDQGILRTFFMSGGPGAGKTYVASEIFGISEEKLNTVSYSTGLKLISSDVIFEKKLKDAGYNPKELEKYMKDSEMLKQIVQVRDRAKEISQKRKTNYITGRLGLIIDGTGKNFEKVEKQKIQLKNLGYDCYMIFVNTTLEVALQRNQERERTLPKDLVESAWYETQKNIGKYQKLFGMDSMIIIDNSDTKSKKIIDDSEKEIKKILRKPIKNYIGLNWIKNNM